MAKTPEIRPGDLVKVYTKIKEGGKERITPFQGIVIQVKGSNSHKTFTVRKISAGIGVERIFPVQSPLIAKVEIKKKGKVRRAKLNYLRQRKGRKMKIKEATQKVAKVKEQKEEMPEGKTAKPEEQEKRIPEEQKTEEPKEQKGESAPGQKAVEKT